MAQRSSCWWTQAMLSTHSIVLTLHNIHPLCPPCTGHSSDQYTYTKAPTELPICWWWVTNFIHLKAPLMGTPLPCPCMYIYMHWLATVYPSIIKRLYIFPLKIIYQAWWYADDASAAENFVRLLEWWTNLSTLGPKLAWILSKPQQNLVCHQRGALLHWV